MAKTLERIEKEFMKLLKLSVCAAVACLISGCATTQKQTLSLIETTIETNRVAVPSVGSSPYDIAIGTISCAVLHTKQDEFGQTVWAPCPDSIGRSEPVGWKVTLIPIYHLGTLDGKTEKELLTIKGEPIRTYLETNLVLNAHK